MIEDLLFSALGQNERMKEFVTNEISRLMAKGYVGDDSQELVADVLKRLEDQAEKARTNVGPLLKGLGSTLRDALDVPSRSEILALTEALKRAEERDGQDT
jgi:hypothetical protein